MAVLLTAPRVCITCKKEKGVEQYYSYVYKGGRSPMGKCKVCYKNRDNPNYHPVEFKEGDWGLLN